MDTKKREQLARELSQIAIATLAAATGGLFVNPEWAAVAAPAAAGVGTALSRMLDRIKLGRGAQDYIETTRSALLELTQDASDSEISSAFATALDALMKSGLSARRFARLNFNAYDAAKEVAKASGYYNLEEQNGQKTLAFRCLETLYLNYRGYEKNRFELEQAFQNELLARTTNLAGLDEALRPLFEAISWQTLLEMPFSQYYPDSSTITLLSPKYQILPYRHRAEDEAFEEWLEQRTDHPIGIAVVQALGGSGKTRWLLEQCERRDASWRAGFLRKEKDVNPLASYQAIFGGQRKILVVVDYAEDHLEQVSKLLDAAVSALNEGADHLRIVLLSRNLTDQWWDDLRPRVKDRARGWINRGTQVLNTIELKSLTPHIEDRNTVFKAAVDALRPFIEAPSDINGPPDLTPPFYGNPLFVQLAALSLLRGGDAPLSDIELLEETVAHEARYWMGGGLSRHQVEPVLAVITLWQGLAPGGMRALVERWPNQDSIVSSTDPTELSQRLRRLYPGEQGGIAPLLPDRLGEFIVLRTLDYEAQSLTQAAFGPQASDSQRRQAFNVLIRMPASARDQLAKIGGMLADIVKQQGDVTFARRLMAQLPEYSVGLAEVKETAARTVRDYLLANRQEDQDDRAELARVIGYHGVSLANLGRREQALDAAQETADLYRQVAEQRPDAFTPDLAGSLNNLANRLSELGRREQALDAAQEAADLYRQLAEQRPDAFTPNLAMSLNNLANRLSELGRREQALDAAQEAADLYRQLAEQRPDAFTPNLAMSLNNLATFLSELGRREQALDAAQEAADLYRQLAAQRPDAFTPDLAMSLNNLANRLSELGRREQALDAAQEAADLYRQLAEQRPDAFTPDLAMSLNNLANRLSELGRREQALDAAQEAADLYRQLAAQRPDAFTPNLAASLNNLANRLSELGRREQALDAAQEAVKLRRQLAKQRPDAFTPNLAMSLNNLANRLSELGRREQALDAAQEAVKLRRQLAGQRPDAFTPNLAMSLNNLATFLSELGRREQALDAAQEAADLYRQLAGQRPDAFTPNLAMSLNNLATFLSELGRREQALDAAQEAADLYRQLAGQRPDAFTPNLAMSLNNLATFLSELGRREQALDAAQEAVKLRRQLAEQRPDAFTPNLAMSLNNLANRLSELGRREQALDAAQEAVKLRRQLAEQRPDAFTPDLAVSLDTLGSVLQQDGNTLDAAVSAFAEGIERLAPLFVKLPMAYDALMQNLVRRYLKACQELGNEPDTVLLGPVVEALQRLRKE